MAQLKVLFFDIETTPIVGMAWQVYDVNRLLKVVKDWELLCFAYKWQGEKEVKWEGRKDMTKDSEEKLVKKLYDLFNEAHVVIAQNGDRFDNKKARAKFIEYKLAPPKPYRTIDTVKIARSEFGFSSNALNDLANTFKLPKKVQTGGFQLWEDCMAMSKAAWKLMKEYNIHDVTILEQLYDIVKPWYGKHPDLHPVAEAIQPPQDVGKPVNTPCRVCGSTDRTEREWNYTGRTPARTIKCNKCFYQERHKIKLVKTG